ncbi:Amino acid/polyamine transporter I [Penicillium italicum]|uniref:Amino acid/polyamine transporter I n=1 Tax=Penicillium italicum TaxID=40296 RepID=A0A0A2KEG0_PENIT|nr:Amino acid/polyamine transporter I [Penicillium italicum]
MNMGDQEKSKDLNNLERNVSVSVGTEVEVRKRFSTLNVLAVCVTLMATWEAMGTFDKKSLPSSPTSAGQIEWTVILAPPHYARLCGWITGWITTLGWQAFTASAAFIGGTMIQGLVVLQYPNYHSERWHGTMLYWAILLLAFLVNTVGIRLMPMIENGILVFHIVTLIAVIIPLVVLAPHKSAEYVFTTFKNSSGWENDGVAWFLGLLSASYVLVGYDGACHLSEEMHNASTVLPRVMIGTIALNSMLGLGFLFALLFCIGDIESVLNTSLGFPIIQIFYNTTGSHAATVALITPFLSVAIASTFGLLASTSRTTWAFAKDGGLPFSEFIAQINEASELPLHAIVASTIFMALLGLINIGSTTAFNAITSLAVVSLHVSYLIPIGLHLLRRFTGPPLQYGPFKLGNLLGPTMNVLALMYSTVIIIFLFFPPYQPVTPQNMNYAIVVFGAVMVWSGVLWITKGKRVFLGRYL